jgi:hypothetical protein
MRQGSPYLSVLLLLMLCSCGAPAGVRVENHASLALCDVQIGFRLPSQPMEVLWEAPRIQAGGSTSCSLMRPDDGQGVVCARRCDDTAIECAEYNILGMNTRSHVLVLDVGVDGLSAALSRHQPM